MGMTEIEQAAHKARIEWMNAMGQGHYSRVSATWHVKKFTERIRLEERARIVRLFERALCIDDPDTARQVRKTINDLKSENRTTEGQR